MLKGRERGREGKREMQTGREFESERERGRGRKRERESEEERKRGLGERGVSRERGG